METEGRHTISSCESLKEYRRYAVKAAKELMYDEEYIHQIKKAGSESEIARILHTAAERSYE